MKWRERVQSALDLAVPNNCHVQRKNTTHLSPSPAVVFCCTTQVHYNMPIKYRSEVPTEMMSWYVEEEYVCGDGVLISPSKRTLNYTYRVLMLLSLLHDTSSPLFSSSSFHPATAVCPHLWRDQAGTLSPCLSQRTPGTKGHDGLQLPEMAWQPLHSLAGHDSSTSSTLHFHPPFPLSIWGLRETASYFKRPVGWHTGGGNGEEEKEEAGKRRRSRLALERVLTGKRQAGNYALALPKLKWAGILGNLDLRK